MKTSKLFVSLLCIIVTLTGCSTTSNIPADDQLFVGLKKTKYDITEKGVHFSTTRDEIEAALATKPNGSLFGSSTVRSPFPVGLWIWNAFSGSENELSKWVVKTFGSKPVLMSSVNPELHASVAQQVLRAHGYFRGQVDYQILPQRHPKKAKVAYSVYMGPLFKIDSLRYENFPPVADSLIRATLPEAKIKSGDAFDVSTLDAERRRVSNLFRNNGFYYYQPGYSIYLADTISRPDTVLLRLVENNDIPDVAKRKWYIGNVDLELRKGFLEELERTVTYDSLAVHFNGRRPRVRPSVIMRGLKLRSGQLYNSQNHMESLNAITSTGIFSIVDFNFVPRDTTGLNDTLDLRLNCVLDKPYDFYIEGNLTGKSSNRFGPGVSLGLTKRNAFRGGELLNINMAGNYEWQTGHRASGAPSKFASYEYSLEMSLQFPRLMTPFSEFFSRRLRRIYHRKKFFANPTTTFKITSDIINRAKYFRRHIVTGEWGYNLQTSATMHHEISPVIFTFEYMSSSTQRFDSIRNANPYLLYTMQNQFVPKFQYAFTYSGPPDSRHPFFFKTTLSEAGNLLSLGYMAAGKKWNEKNKKLFKNPYAQFLKVEAELVKAWNVGKKDQIVARLGLGAIWSYGNALQAPYGEQFIAGGANSIRAFTVRSVGPGSYHDPKSADIYYLDQTGDLKILANLEYRPRLFGNLYGAVFLDAGNVWSINDDYRTGGKFRFKNILKEMALGTGVGVRYDLDFLVIRLDYGIGIHVPYKPGFYNMDSFKNSGSLHFAVGYPF